MKLPVRYKCDWCGTVDEGKGDAFSNDYPSGWVHNSADRVDYCGECVRRLIIALPLRVMCHLGGDKELKELLSLLRILRATDFEKAKKETPQEDA